MKSFFAIPSLAFALVGLSANAQSGYNQNPNYQQPVQAQYQLGAPQTMSPRYQLPAPQGQVVQPSYLNRAGQWVQQRLPNMARGFVTGQVLGQPVRRYFENRGAYCPPKPIFIPGTLAPAYYVATCAYPAY